MAHTPGLWAISQFAEYGLPAIITDDNGGVLIAKTIGLDAFHDSQDCETENANARLIAAAPELLDALKKLAIMARTSGGTAGRDEYLVSACEFAESVIRKTEQSA